MARETTIALSGIAVMARRVSDLLVVCLLCVLLILATASEGTYVHKALCVQNRSTATLASLAVCEDYGAVSDCTSGFPTLFHIDKLAKGSNTDLKNEDKRQVVIPSINFGCNGIITRWIFGAKWTNKNPDKIELQIWRRNSQDQYIKVNGTTVTIDDENDTEVYELETSLAFQEGDVLGYFQPDDKKTLLDLYLEDLGRIQTYWYESVVSIFILENKNMDKKYPLIAVRTDPPGCGCGFMASERVYALRNIPPLMTGSREEFNTGQMIFPNITFSCSGHVTKWILAAKWNNNKPQFPDLQIWKPTGDGIYEKRGSTTIMWMEQKEDDEVYEFQVHPPLLFMAGDILGLFQPNPGQSRLEVRYDDDISPEFYAIDESSDMFTISTSGVLSTTGIPLVTVEIGKLTLVCSISFTLFLLNSSNRVNITSGTEYFIPHSHNEGLSRQLNPSPNHFHHDQAFPRSSCSKPSSEPLTQWAQNKAHSRQHCGSHNQHYYW